MLTEVLAGASECLAINHTTPVHVFLLPLILMHAVSTGGIKSAHDALQDEKLSREKAYADEQQEQQKRAVAKQVRI